MTDASYPDARYPVDALLPELIEVLKEGRNAVLRAPTGAGKTTRIPPALLAAHVAGGKQIIMLEPRRLAARAAARWMARERDEKVGGAIGFQVRFERKASKRTRILVVTEGILLRLLQSDPFLENVGVLLFDEFHERRLESDLILAMARRVQREANSTLRLVAMSATLGSEECARLARFLGGAPLLESAGRAHPVSIRYLDRVDDRAVAERTAEGVTGLLTEQRGDILAFLPGVREIDETARWLRRAAGPEDLQVVPLHGRLAPTRQDAALKPSTRRRVVLATNVAETSVTVPGVTAVVDSGLVRQNQLDAEANLSRLVLTEVSHSSADQRAGRAGRTQPGVALRLWTERQHASRPAETRPEIERSDLSAALLELLCWGESDLALFPWFQPPPAEHLASAHRLLKLLGALEEGRVTSVGQEMAALPTHPRTARFLVEASRLGCARQASWLAVLLEEQDPLRARAPRGGARRQSESDLLDRLTLIEGLDQGRPWAPPPGLEYLKEPPKAVLLNLRQARNQLLQQLGSAAPTASSPDTDEPLLRALVTGFPDRMARRNPGIPRRGVLAGGLGVLLTDESSVLDGELFLCHQFAGGTRTRRGETRVTCASAVAREWLPQHLIQTSQELTFDPDRQAVAAHQLTTFAGLVIQKSRAGVPDASATARILAAEAAPNLREALAVDAEPARTFLARVRWLGQQVPELALPAFDDAELLAVLPELCVGRRSFADLRRAPLVDALRGRLTHEQLRALAQEAPKELTVPSGSRIALCYQEGQSPVLEVRIQELFGLAETPRLARGRAPVLLHLLAPNYRPQQVTDDLASFWRETYFKIRKELRRRYPKHPWPEDPLTAKAVRK